MRNDLHELKRTSGNVLEAFESRAYGTFQAGVQQYQMCTPQDTPVFDMIWFNNYGLRTIHPDADFKVGIGVHHLALVLIQLMSMGESHCALQLRNTKWKILKNSDKMYEKLLMKCKAILLYLKVYLIPTHTYNDLSAIYI